jgi:hypothetical protein
VRLTKRRENYNSEIKVVRSFSSPEDVQMHGIVSLFIGMEYSFGKITTAPGKITIAPKPIHLNY